MYGHARARPDNPRLRHRANARSVSGLVYEDPVTRRAEGNPLAGEGGRHRPTVTHLRAGQCPDSPTLGSPFARFIRAPCLRLVGDGQGACT